MKEEKRFYIREVEDKFVPYWLSFTDNEYGGILNCITNDGNTLISQDKYIWSQGRWLYILSLILGMKEYFPNLDIERIKTEADNTASFLLSHSFDENYCCVFKTDRKGNWLKDEENNYYSSIYADCFVAIGLSEYSYFASSSLFANTALRITDSILKRIESGNFYTQPYMIPPSYISHGIPMILTNVLEVVSRMMEKSNLDSSFYRKKQKEFVLSIFNKHLDKERSLIREYVSITKREENLLTRHINPGHTLEDAIFWIEEMESDNSLSSFLPLISSICKATIELGWDKEKGGLFRFVDMDGGEPKGNSNNTEYEKLVQSTWDMKLWWPHSEMLYLFLKLYSLTKDTSFLTYYKKTKEYAFSTFPSRSNGEWDQIRERDGSSSSRFVALPVKDPFHILRDFLKIIKLSDNICL